MNLKWSEYDGKINRLVSKEERSPKKSTDDNYWKERLIDG